MYTITTVNEDDVLTFQTATMRPMAAPQSTSDAWCILSVTRLRHVNSAAVQSNASTTYLHSTE